jgi:hypothetical protein
MSMLHFDYHPNKSTTYKIEQEFHYIDCCLPPPYTCCNKGAKYKIFDRKNDKKIGEIDEKPDCCSKVCCTADARSVVTELEFFGKKYEVVKDCKFSYLCPACGCCRPDAFVNKNGVTIGYIKLPCCPVIMCG